MANNYSQFSEMVDDLSPEALAWTRVVLGFDFDEGEVEAGKDKLKKELALEDDLDLSYWPGFNWSIENNNSLWLYSEEGCDYEHVQWFISALINKFMPNYIFTMTMAETCSKPRISEFGGGWLVITKDDIQGGNSYDAAEACVKEIEAKRAAAAIG